MKIETLIRHIAVLVLVTLFGCGGGGGGGGGGDASTSSTVVVRVKTSGVAVPLYGVQFKAALPAGVTLSTDSNGNLAAGILKATGGAVGANIECNYQSGASPQTLAVSVAISPSGGGFLVGEFLTVFCTVAPGTVLSSTDIKFSEFKVFDKGGAEISGATGLIEM